MRAVLCEEWGGPEKLRLAEVATPEPGEGEIRIRVRAAGVNFPDVLIIQNKYQFKPSLPFSPGSEVAGEVSAVGTGVDGFQVGDRVLGGCTFGGFAEEVVARAANFAHLPEGVAWEPAGAFLLAYGTSWHALRDRAALRAGETVLVLGASGGVGLSAVEIAKLSGARVIAAASSDAKLAICRDYGADATINYSTEDLRQAIARYTDKRGPDVIYDPVGDSFAEPAFRSIAWRGRYLVVGFAAGKIPALPLNLALLKGASIVGVFWGDHTRREPDIFARDTAEMLGHLAAGRLKPNISHVYALEEAPQALMDMAARKVVGKIVIRP